VRLKDGYGDGPDIARLLEASSTGASFLTSRTYEVGTNLLLSFPYPASFSLTQTGRVARVEETQDGMRRISVTLG
jgi:hypothetical protein